MLGASRRTTHPPTHSFTHPPHLHPPSILPPGGPEEQGAAHRRARQGADGQGPGGPAVWHCGQEALLLPGALRGWRGGAVHSGVLAPVLWKCRAAFILGEQPYSSPEGRRKESAWSGHGAWACCLRSEHPAMLSGRALPGVCSAAVGPGPCLSPPRCTDINPLKHWPLQVPVALMDGIIGLLDFLARFFPGMKVPAVGGGGWAANPVPAGLAGRSGRRWHLECALWRQRAACSRRTGLTGTPWLASAAATCSCSHSRPLPPLAELPQDSAEFGKIGKYYAVESMLLWDPETQQYLVRRRGGPGAALVPQWLLVADGRWGAARATWDGSAVGSLVARRVLCGTLLCCTGAHYRTSRPTILHCSRTPRPATARTRWRTFSAAPSRRGSRWVLGVLGCSLQGGGGTAFDSVAVLWSGELCHQRLLLFAIDLAED